MGQIVGFQMQHRQSQKRNSFQSIKCHAVKKTQYKTWNQAHTCVLLPFESIAIAYVLTSWPVAHTCVAQTCVWRRVSSTLLPGTCSTRRSPSSVCLIITLMTCTGARPTSAGSRATRTSPTAHWQMEPQVSWSVSSAVVVGGWFPMEVCGTSVLWFCFKSRVSVFFPSLKVFQSTLTPAASGKSLRSIKSLSSTQHPQPSACSWSMDVNLCRSKLPFLPCGAFAVQWNPDIQEATEFDSPTTTWPRGCFSFLPFVV